MKKQSKLGMDVTKGVIWKQILFLFFPILFGALFQQLYNTVDMIIVGRFVGTIALASVGGSSGQLVYLIIGFFTGLAAGAGVVISQFFGAGNMKQVQKAISTAYAFSIAGGIIFTILGIAFSPVMLRWMNTPEETFALSVLYLRIYFAGMLFIFIFNIGSGILRSLGNTTLPLLYLAICSVLNIVMDLVLVVLCGMGVAGAALATLLSQAVSAVLVTGSLMRADAEYALQLRRIRFDVPILKSQLKLGLPTGMQSTMYSIANILVQTAFNTFGTVVVAATSTDMKIESLFWMISSAFGVALTTFAGQNYGAGNWKRIYQGTGITLLLDQLATILISAIMYVFASPLFGIFSTDPDVIRTGSSITRLCAPFLIAFSFVECFSAMLRAINDVVIPMFLTMFGVCLLRIVWIAIAMHNQAELLQVMFNYPFTWMVTAVLFIVYYLYKKKKLAKT